MLLQLAGTYPLSVHSKWKCELAKCGNSPCTGHLQLSPHVSASVLGCVTLLGVGNAGRWMCCLHVQQQDGLEGIPPPDAGVCMHTHLIDMR